MTNAFAIIPGFWAMPARFLWHPGTSCAILADLHLGIEATLVRSGLWLSELPSTQGQLPSFSDIAKLNPRRVIVAGDLFDSPSPDEKAIQQAVTLLAELPGSCQVIVTPGNHDPSPSLLREILGGSVSIEDSTRVGDACVSHGHVPPDSPCSTWIAGHQHPSVIIRGGMRAAKMMCFALCRAAPVPGVKATLILPAFSRMALGSDLLQARLWLLPVTRPPASRIRIAGIVEHPQDNRVLDFGPLSALA